MTAQITFTAPILLPGDPSSSNQASNKNYVDNGLSGKANSTHTHAESDVTSLATDLAAKAPTASPTFTGLATFSDATVDSPTTLTDGTTVSVNASNGNFFRLTLTATGHTMGAPSSPTDGQKILFQITAGGAYTFAWATGAGGYEWGTDVTVPTLSQTSGKIDYIGFIYNSSANLWHGLAWSRGY
jgi:hypothetical protein